ncbi:MAG: hypothetical protein ACOCX1_05240, partial [Fimbriimonadaceae bacterium]
MKKSILAIAGISLFSTSAFGQFSGANAWLGGNDVETNGLGLIAEYGGPSLGDGIRTDDLIAGVTGTKVSGNFQNVGGYTHALEAGLTDGIRINSDSVDGLLNDFPGSGNPALVMQYDFGTATNIGALRLHSGNDGRDGRVFHSYLLRFSTDGTTFTDDDNSIFVQSAGYGQGNTA